MADVSWPTADDFPQDSQLLGYQETPPENVIRTPMDTGPPKLRRRSTAGVRNLTVFLFLDDTTQMGHLDDFYVTDTYSGSIAFEWTHPRTGATTDFRFRAPPQYRHLGNGNYRAQLELEILP